MNLFVKFRDQVKDEMAHDDTLHNVMTLEVITEILAREQSH